MTPVAMTSLRGSKMPLWYGKASSAAAFKVVFGEYLRMITGHTHERIWQHDIRAQGQQNEGAES